MRALVSLRQTIRRHRHLHRVARAVRAAAHAARDPADAVLAARKLRRAAASGDAAGVVDAAFTISVGEVSLSPVQIRAEIIGFLELLAAEAPRRVLEIGTGNSGTLFLLSWAAAPDARLLSVDIRKPPRSRGILYHFLSRSFAGRRRVALRTADSHSGETQAAVSQFFGRVPLDAVLIDGDHSYEGVRRDYELYAPLVRPGGLIAFHDIVEGPPSAVGEVPRFWREVRSSLDDPIEFVESWSQGGYGIGVGRAVWEPVR